MSHRIIQSKTVGFTIVEMLIIAPIVILVIGTFISVIVNMTGEILMTRGANSLSYNIQDALNRIESDVKLSTTFLATNSVALTAPQGYNDGVAVFNNVDSSSGNHMLILNTLATTGNPVSTSSGLVYLTDKPNACASAQVNQNNPMTMNVVYFVKDGSLWRRTIMPADYLEAGCVDPWQQPSCSPAVSNAFCKTQDSRLVDNVDPEDFVLQYFNSAGGDIDDDEAVDGSKTSTERGIALQTDTTVVASLTIDKTIAGRDINQRGSIRATRLDVNASTIAPVVPDIVPAAPTVVASINPSTPTTVNFSWNSVPGATSYSMTYTLDSAGANQWVAGPTNSTVTSYSVTSQHGKIVCATVYANSPAGQSPFGSKCITIPLWGSFMMQNLWSDYSSAWAAAGFTKTSAGVVMLKGMIKRAGTPVAGEVIATLPDGYRPAEMYMFSTSSADASTRVDIYPNGRIVFNTGNPAWLSLEGISFVPAGSSYTWTSATTLNGWVNYGGGWATAGYTRDSLGRVFIKGLVGSGTTTASTPIINVPAGYRTSEYLHLPTTGNNTFDATGVDVSGNITTKGNAINGYRSIQHRYYASGYATWNNLSLQNSWTHYAGYASPQYTKGSDGIVSVKGLITGGTATSGTVIATLPAGYRPKDPTLIGANCMNAYCRLDVYPNGNILARAGVSSGWTALEAITFLAEQ